VVTFSAPVQTSPGTHPASYTVITGLLPGVKWLGHGINYPPQSSAKVKERVELCLYSHLSSIMAGCRVNCQMTNDNTSWNHGSSCNVTFYIIVFVSLRCNTLELGDGCLMFRDSMLVSSSRFEVFNDWTVGPLKIRLPCCLWNVHHSPSDMAPHPRRIKTSTALKWKPKNLNILCNVYFS